MKVVRNTPLGKETVSKEKLYVLVSGDGIYDADILMEIATKFNGKE